MQFVMANQASGGGIFPLVSVCMSSLSSFLTPIFVCWCRSGSNRASEHGVVSLAWSCPSDGECTSGNCSMEWDQIVRLLSPPWLLSRCTVPIAIKPKLRNSSTSYDTLFTLFRHVRDYRPAGQMAKSIICSLLLLAFAGSVAAEDIEVFVVPHTHDDVGWIITMENYYTAEVQYIIDTMIEQLEANPARRFIYVEVALSFVILPTFAFVYFTLHSQRSSC